jgi:pyruvate/2-oxoglutarate/acetoin dehydrogenase E1 component
MTGQKTTATVTGMDLAPTLTFGQALGAALLQAMREDPRVFAFGEGINDRGGFFGSTEGLAAAVGNARCFDVPNCEEALVGMGVGASLLGRRPVMVNLRIEFLMLAMNQIVNHAAKWPSMSGGRAQVPLTLRAMIGKHWGQAAQHSGALYPLFAHVPGLEVVVPGSFEDAPGLLLAAIQSDRPTIFIEEKPLYETSGPVTHPIQPVPLGRARVVRPGKDLTIVAVATGVHLACRAATVLAGRGVEAEVIDVRTIAPLDTDTILSSIARTRRAAVVDIAWPRFGLTGEIARLILTHDPGTLRGPLLAFGPRDAHAPASCFLEQDHYPRLERVVADLSRALGVGT